MILEHFDQNRFPAVENMALDLLMLESYPRPDVLRLRHYSWEPDCFTFGYSQVYEWIEGQAVRGAQLARRPTGGGFVDHRNDWTYAFVIPAGHPLHHAPAIDVYRLVHDSIAQAMSAIGRPAVLQPEEDEQPDIPGMPKRVRGLCFAGAEPCDVIAPESRLKIAGAAMKRNKNGVLIQGSIDRLVTGDLDWTAFRERFVAGLAAAFDADESVSVDAPDYGETVRSAAVEKIGSDHWNRRR